jgi:HPt (histidine-containing phosphotransfer) domain-containing protein
MSDDRADVLDTTRLETLVDEIGDRDLVRHAVQAFLDEVPVRLHAIKAAVADLDHEAVNSSAHALGSPAAMLGALAVRTETRRLQAAAGEQAHEDYPGLVDSIETATARTEHAMRRYLDSPVSA